MILLETIDIFRIDNELYEKKKQFVTGEYIYTSMEYKSR